MAEIKNPSFEDADPTGYNPGVPDDWTIQDFNFESWMWAPFQGGTPVEFWPVERFESGWNNNDGFIDELEPADLYPFVVDGGDVETFEYWTAGSLMVWIEEFEDSDLFPAFFSIWGGMFPAFSMVEGFESLWNNDLPIAGTYIHHLESFIDGVVVEFDVVLNSPIYRIGGDDSIQVVVSRWFGGFPQTFSTVIQLTAGTYDQAGILVELQTKSDAALTAAGAPFAPGDFVWETAPTGGLRLRLTKSDATRWYLWMIAPGSSAWDELGFSNVPQVKDLSHLRPLEDDSTERALYAPGFDWEWFDFGWGNDYDEYLWHGESWIDGHDAGPSFVINGGSNDTAWIFIDDLGGSATMLQMTLTPGTYNLASMVIEFQTQLVAALTAAGPPWAAGHMVIQASPKGQIRIMNQGGIVNLNMWLYRPTNSAWEELGFEPLDEMDAIAYPDRNSRRVDADNTAGILWERATYVGPLWYEGFEDPGWPVLP